MTAPAPPAMPSRSSQGIWSVIGRGSYFADAVDPKDIDVIVVTDEPISTGEAVDRVTRLVGALPGARSLPLDVHVASLDDLSIWERAVILDGHLIDGDDVRPLVRPVVWPEWAYFMAWWYQDVRQSDPPAAALAAVRGALARRGVAALSKALVPGLAAGTRWQELAEAAWSHRGQPRLFEHPDLDEAGAACVAAAAGETVEAAGTVALTTYREALTDLELDRAVGAVTGALTAFEGGWRKCASPDLWTTATLWTVAQIANANLWRRELDACEQLELHRHPVGSAFPTHVDRHEDVAPAMRAEFPEANLDLLTSRLHNVVAMVQPAAAGGHLQIQLEPGPLHEPHLQRGDVAIFDGQLPHSVTRVDAGERVVLVTHTHERVHR